MRLFIHITLAAAVFAAACAPKNKEKLNPIRVENGVRQQPKYNQRIVKTVANDPLNVKEYTLKNGLKVYLTVNKEEPRIETMITVKAGGKNDPAHATGLAHYLEHLLFKGTDKLNTVDWEKEKVELDKIKALYEQYRSTSDSLERAVIYKQIDSLSAVAAQYACLSEFDQLHSEMGASGTNAYTAHDNTSYLTNIPSNQLKNWLKLEAERFSKPALRLFHTELEAVYEEKNRSQDNHFRQQYYALLSELFKKHTYGTQTTIGTIEHLKNPSIVEIEKFFNHYYVPNNMAIILSGDFNPDSAIVSIEAAFGDFKPAPVDEYVFDAEEEIKYPVIKRIKAPDASSLLMAYRLPKAGHPDVYLAKMMDMVLNNSKAGLIDLNINQKQKAVGVYSGINVSADYSYHILGGSPTKRQSLDSLLGLINDQIELVKKGEFPDWLIPAIINDFKVRELKALQSNKNRIAAINTAFVQDLSWFEKTNELKTLSAITKDDLVAFANRTYRNNYIAVFKEQTDEKLARTKVPKPAITPLNIPQQNQSEFFKDFVSNNNPQPIEPSFINFDNEVQVVSLGDNSSLNYCANNNDELFTLRFVYPRGEYDDALLALAAAQVSMLPTNKFTAAQLNQEMYKIGMSYSVAVAQQETYITLSGLTSQFDSSLALFNHIFENVVADNEVVLGLIQKQLQLRQMETTSSRSLLWNGLQQYAVFGKNSPLNSELSNEQLKKITAQQLISKLKQLLNYKAQVLYYGPTNPQELKSKLRTSPFLSGNQNASKREDFKRLSMDENKIYLLDYDLKQSEVLLLSKGSTFNPSELALNSVFNEYYGGGMSSVVFQEIREKKALAYQAFAVHTSAKDTVKPQYTYGFLGCQIDKTTEAIASLFNILKNMPIDTLKFNQAKKSIQQQLASNRTTRASKLYSYWNNSKLGLTTTTDELVYKALNEVTFTDVQKFHQNNIANNNYSIVIISDLSELDINSLKQFGSVEILNIDDLYPYNN